MYLEVLGRRSSRPVRVREGLKLSPNEERYLLAETISNQVYMAPSGARLRGPIDTEHLAEAIKATCDRHESRRTGYEIGPDGQYTKYVLDRAIVDVKTLKMPGASDAEIEKAVRDYIYVRGDFSPGMLHRYVLIEVGRDDNVFAFSLHHATSDGVTMRNFVMEIYSRLITGQAPPEAPQYSQFWDFDWEASEAYRTAMAFWSDRLRHAMRPATWPADRSPGVAALARPSVTRDVPADVLARTAAAAAELGVSQFTYFYAVYLVLLSRLTASEVVQTTFQSAGRRALRGSDAAQGVFSNSLILALRVDQSRSIADLARDLKDEIRLAIAHEIAPYHHVIRTTGVHPKYAINWYPEMSTVTFDNIEITPLQIEENQDDDDLNLRYVTYGDRARFMLFYNPSAFSADRVQAAVDAVVELADALAIDLNQPLEAISSRSLPVASALASPDQALPTSEPGLITDAFMKAAATEPDRTALVEGSRKVSYGELEVASRAFAVRLLSEGLGAGARIAIVAERRAELVCAMLGVARSGAAFAILDADEPPARLAVLAREFAPSAVVSAGGRSEAAGAQLARELAAPHIPARFGARAEAPPADTPGLDSARPDDLAYVVFTSGTTGRPKAVAASHRPLTHFVRWQIESFELTADDRFTMLSGLSHDPLLRDVFTPLSVGAAVLIPPEEVRRDPVRLPQWIRSSEATVCHLTPPLGRVATARAARRPWERLRLVFWGGDRLPLDLCRAMAERAPGSRQINFYGCTETPQAVAYWTWRQDDDHSWAPIGSGIDGTQLLVVDRGRQALGVGELGEIAVRSPYLSLGAFAEGVLRPDPSRSDDGCTYFTGDRGFHLPDGSVFFVGRADDQLKIRGHRVELAEVSAALLDCRGVSSAAVLATGKCDDQQMRAFVVGDGQTQLTDTALKSELAGRLPAFMVPQAIRVLAAMPLLANGKVDRDALAALGDAPTPRSTTNTSPLEKRLISRWSELLNLDNIGPESSFASLGGDSLSYVEAYLATEEALGEAPVGWHLMTIAELARTRVRRPSSGWSVVDMPVLLRAAAILLVVVGHFAYSPRSAGATGALLLLSGFMFGSLALPEIYARRSLKPVLRLIRNVFVPTAILSLGIFIARLPGNPPPSYILTFSADLQDYQRLLPMKQGTEIYLWFVHALLHILLVLAGVLAILRAAGALRYGPRAMLYGLFAVGCALRFLLPAWADPAFVRGALSRGSFFNFAPTTHLATFALGGLIATASTRGRQMRTAAVLSLYALATAPLFGGDRAGFLFLGGALLLTAPRVWIPRVISPAVFAIASASLWIYLTHMIIVDGLGWLGNPAFARPPAMMLAIVAGVAVWLLWTRGQKLLSRWMRSEPTAPIPAI